MACRVDKFSPLCLFACFYLQTCETCVYVFGHYVGLRCVCVSVTDRAIESTYRENLTTLLHPLPTRMSLSPWLHAPVLPLFLYPSCTACLSQRCTPACLKPSHSPGALSSVGGNTLNFHMMEWNITLQTGAQLIFISVKLLLHSNADPALSTAQSLAGNFLRYILCVSCVHLFRGQAHPKTSLLAVGWRGNERNSGRFANWADKRLRGKKLKGGKWWSSLEASVSSD